MTGADIFSLWEKEILDFQAFYKSLDTRVHSIDMASKRERVKIESEYNDSIELLEKNRKHQVLSYQNKLEENLSTLEKNYEVDMEKAKSKMPSKNISPDTLLKNKAISEKKLEEDYNQKIIGLSNEFQKQKNAIINPNELESLGQNYFNDKQQLTIWYGDEKRKLEQSFSDEKKKSERNFEDAVNAVDAELHNLSEKNKKEQLQIKNNTISLSNENTRLVAAKKKNLYEKYQLEIGQLKTDIENETNKVRNDFYSKKNSLLAVEKLLENQGSSVNKNSSLSNFTFHYATLHDEYISSIQLAGTKLRFEVEAKIFINLNNRESNCNSNILVFFSDKSSSNAFDFISFLTGKFLAAFEVNNLKITIGARNADDVPREFYQLAVPKKFSHPTPEDFPMEFEKLKAEVDFIVTKLHVNGKISVKEFNIETQEKNLKHNVFVLYDISLQDYANYLDTLKQIIENSNRAGFICVFGLNVDKIPKDEKNAAAFSSFVDFLSKRSLVFDYSQQPTCPDILEQYKLSKESVITFTDSKVSYKDIADKINKEMVELSQKNYLPITDYLTFDLCNWQSNKALKEITFPIGLFYNTKNYAQITISSSLGKTSRPHWIIGTPTGKGKSNFFDVLLTSIGVKYSPEQVNFFLIDKAGGTFEKYIGKLPHIKYAALNVGVLEASLILNLLLKEYERRLSYFKSNKVEEYKELKTNDDLPRIILLIDEINALLKEDIDESFISDIQFASQQFRKYGIHIILSGQAYPSQLRRSEDFGKLKFFPEEVHENALFENLPREVGYLVVGDTKSKEKSEAVVDTFASKWEENGETIFGSTNLVNRIPPIEKSKLPVVLDFSEPLFINEQDLSDGTNIWLGKDIRNENVGIDLFKKIQKNNICITGGETEEREGIIYSMLFQINKTSKEKVHAHLFYCNKPTFNWENGGNLIVKEYNDETEIRNKIEELKNKKLYGDNHQHIFVVSDIENTYDPLISSFSDNPDQINFPTCESLFKEIIRTYSYQCRVRFIFVSHRMESIEQAYTDKPYSTYKNPIHEFSQYFLILNSDKKEMTKIIDDRLPFTSKNLVLFYDKNSGHKIFLRPFKINYTT